MQNKSSIELEYIFIGMKFNVDFVEGNFTDDEKKEITDFIDRMSQTIYIDKTYVESNDNNRKSTFMLENGWNALKDTMLDTRFCRYLHNQGEGVIVDAFATMGRCYMYECLSTITDRLTSINITVKDDCEFEVIVCKDESHGKELYLGKWQDWEFDDEGHFLSSHIFDKKHETEVNSDDE